MTAVHQPLAANFFYHCYCLLLLLSVGVLAATTSAFSWSAATAHDVVSVGLLVVPRPCCQRRRPRQQQQQHGRGLPLISSSSSIVGTTALGVSGGGGTTTTDHHERSESTTTTTSTAATAKHILYDLPVSNNGARCRLILYKKGLPSSEVAIVSPMELGGLTSEEYQQVNPQCKMPALYTENSGLNLAESDTIARYLMNTYATTGPSFQPDNPRSNLLARFHDIYITTIQGCLYKPAPPFGIFGTRQDALLELQKQLQVLESYMVNDGLYLCGDQVSYADATIFPTLVFCHYMMPKFQSAVEGFDGKLPDKLEAYFQRVQSTDAAFRKVHDEIMDVLVNSWDEGRQRWDGIWLAGDNYDHDPPTIFDKIINKEIPATIVKETKECLAFADINPAAPSHVLVIPKHRNALSGLQTATPEHGEILGKLMILAGEIAADESLGFGPDNGARIVINDGAKFAGQEVPHLHIHVLGGRPFEWPPG